MGASQLLASVNKNYLAICKSCFSIFRPCLVDRYRVCKTRRAQAKLI